MRLMQGRSAATAADEAVAEAAADFEGTPEILFAFASTKQSPERLHTAMAGRFPGVPIVGCTTAGEQLGRDHSTGQVVLLGLAESGMNFSVRAIEGLAAWSADRAESAVAAMRAEVGLEPDQAAEGSAVCLLLIDGLRGQEEHVSACLAEALGGIPLAGGSAGDDLRFAETRVFGPNGARTDAATLVMIHSVSGGPVQLLKHQHFTATPSQLAVTRAEGRTVFEFDGLPAAEAYAEALGLDAANLDAEITFLHPVTFACNGELYVRSIQAIQDDGSIDFYCEVEEGTVLDVGGHLDMVRTLDADLAAGFETPPGLVIGFNCILRALEATAKGLHEPIGCALANAFPHFIGFDTYGEQLNGLHINQTLVAVGLGAAAEEGVR